MDRIERMPQQIAAGLGQALKEMTFALFAGIFGFFAAPFLLTFFKRTGERRTYYFLASSAFASIGGIAIPAAVFFGITSSISGMQSLDATDFACAMALVPFSLLLALGKLASVWARERKGDFVYSGCIGEPRFPIFWKVAGPRADGFRVGAIGSFIVLAAGIAVIPLWPVLGTSLCVIFVSANLFFIVEFLRFRFMILDMRDASLFTQTLQEAAAGPHEQTPGLASQSDETAALLALYSYSKHTK